MSERPPRLCGWFHDKTTVDWSTKLTVKFCGLEGDSGNRKCWNGTWNWRMPPAVKKWFAPDYIRKKNREKLTSARHRLWIFEGSVIILIASAFRRSRVGRHAVVWASLALVVATAVLIFARRTHCLKKKKKKNWRRQSKSRLSRGYLKLIRMSPSSPRKDGDLTNERREKKKG